MISVNSSSYKNYEANNLDNIEFFYTNGTLVQSWLEGNSLYLSKPGASYTSTNTIYWLRINGGIPANNNIILYMGFANTSTNLFDGILTGEASTLSAKYGEYDNGNQIFNYYQSFGGLTTLPSPWQLTIGSGTGTFFPTYYEIGANITAGGINTTNFYQLAGNVYEADLVIPLTTGGYISGYGPGDPKYFETSSKSHGSIKYSDSLGRSTGGSGMAYDGAYNASLGSLQLHISTSNVGETKYNDTQAIYSIGYSSNTTYFLENYNIVYFDVKLPSTTQLLLYVIGNLSGENLYWTRIRTLPPNGIMPSVNFGTIEGITTFSENGLPNSGENWNITYNLNTKNAVVQNSIVFSDIPGNYLFEVSNQIVAGIKYVPNPSNGYVITGNLININFSQESSSSVCTIYLNSNVINFGNLNPNSDIPTSNNIVDTNTGNSNAYMYVFGGNWIGPIQFGVSNTIWAATNNVPFSTASKLTPTLSNTLISIPSTGSNSIYFGLRVPGGTSSGTYQQTITFENSC